MLNNVFKAQKESESWWNIVEEVQHEWFWAKMLNKGTWKVKQQKQKQQKNLAHLSEFRNQESQPLFRSYRKTTGRAQRQASQQRNTENV